MSRVDDESWGEELEGSNLSRKKVIIGYLRAERVEVNWQGWKLSSRRFKRR